jgi:hypothetical protein
VLSQPSVRPTTLRIVVEVPSGTHITSTSPSVHVDGDSAVWEGTPTRRMQLEVTFGP